MIRAVTFDAFGTLIDTGRDVLIHVARAVCMDHRPSLAPEKLLETWDRYFFGAEQGEFQTLQDATDDSLAKTMADYGMEGETGPYIEMLNRMWANAKAFPESAGVLARVDGLPRAVVSNADDAFLKGLLRKNGLSFDHVVTSESVRAYKPRPRIFEVALERLRAEPEDVVHVGDSLTADVEGASRLGMRTVWVNRLGLVRGVSDPRPDREIPDLTPLPDLLAELRRGP
ncbi:MAG TPA: HAD family hydrolase [Thermoplasmata archaeon]|nr:HAD family hydrolase [Thermoplasmata archaeon]